MGRTGLVGPGLLGQPRLLGRGYYRHRPYYWRRYGRFGPYHWGYRYAYLYYGLIAPAAYLPQTVVPTVTAPATAVEK